MNQSYNWSGFYNCLCQNGPDLLLGIDEDLREVIREIGTTTDMFWSENLEGFLARGAADDSFRDGVLLAVDQWRMNVVDQMENSFGMSLDSDEVSINASSPTVDILINAASQG
jgi:hypothetical protein